MRVTGYNIQLMSKNGEDSLDDLYVDRDEINRERLAAALSGIIGIDRETGEMVALTGFRNLSKKNRVIAYLLFRQAAAALGEIEREELGATSREMSDIIGTADSTVRNYFSDLKFIEKDKKNGGYYIPSHFLEEAISKLPEEA